jgi:hypothetical protein
LDFFAVSEVVFCRLGKKIESGVSWKKHRKLERASVRFAQKNQNQRREDSFFFREKGKAIFPIPPRAFSAARRSLAFRETPKSTWKTRGMSETAERLFSHRHAVLGRMCGSDAARDASVRGASRAGSRGSSARGARTDSRRTFHVDRRERVAQLLRRRERTPRLRGFRSERQTRP